MQKQRLQKNKGFVILFAVTLAAILLSIALSVSGLALREIKFGTSGRESNEAFFAADTGAECALFYDQSSPAQNAFGGNAGSMNCAGANFSPSGSDPFWSFDLTGLGPQGEGCARVTLSRKTNEAGLPLTEVIAKGYNTNIGDPGICSPSPNAVERQLEIRY